MDQSSLEILGAAIFAAAVLHTFAANAFKKFGDQFQHGSVTKNIFHLLGEVEVTFGFWAMVLMALLVWRWGNVATLQYAETLNFTEPLFVFAIMTVAATRPILHFARLLMQGISKILPIKSSAALYLSCLIIGPLLGSLITEPAAMTVTALLLKELYFDRDVSERFKYVTLGCLFVNVSIGGILTSFAAPPILMVARRWEWDTSYMFNNYGWQALVAVVTNALLVAFFLRTDFKNLSVAREKEKAKHIPLIVTLVNLAILAAIVFYSHHSIAFMSLFLLFIGVHAVTTEYNDALRLKEALLVAFF
jgi:hypothetical protein